MPIIYVIIIIKNVPCDGSGSDFLYYRVKNQTDIYTGVILSFLSSLSKMQAVAVAGWY